MSLKLQAYFDDVERSNTEAGQNEREAQADKREMYREMSPAAPPATTTCLVDP